MVQVYAVGNENFTNNGDAVLICFSCDLTVELNGTWVLNLEVPLDTEGRWKFITENAVLKVPTWQEDEQLYRILSYTKTESGVSVVAYPIFYDSAKDAFVLDARPTNATGQEALNAILSGTPYSGSSDIATRGTAFFVRRNVLDVICGNDEPTFLQTWGGEILYDNYNITINERVGGDYGVEVRYGKNIDGVRYSVDMTDVVTRIIPVAYNGRTMSGNEPWVDSENINVYPVAYTKVIEYDHIKLKGDADSKNDKDIICKNQAELDAALQAAAEAEFASGIDMPAITLEVDMVAIRHKTQNVGELKDSLNDTILDSDSNVITTYDYLDFATLEKVLLGDTVHCRHRKLGITSDARVIGMTWDCVQKCVKQITLGDYKYNYVSVVSSTIQRAAAVIREDGSVMAEKVQGFLNGQNTAFRTQYDLATHTDTMAIVFENLDQSSPMYGALGIGTQGLCISKTRNEDDRDWVWTTGVTANGLNADMGIFGIIADKMGYNYFNMDTGAAHIGSQTDYLDFDPNTGDFNIRASSLTIRGSDVEEAVTDAAKTATNYLYYDAQNGLIIKEDAGRIDQGMNIQIKGSKISFRNHWGYLASIEPDCYTIYQMDDSSDPAMVVDRTGMQFYDTTGTLAAQYTAEGMEVIKGVIGGWVIGAGSIHSASDHDPYVVLSPSATGNNDIFSVQVGTEGAYTYPFWVRADGYMHANTGDIGGIIFEESSGGVGSNMRVGQNGSPINLTPSGAMSVVALNTYGDISVHGGNIYIDGSPISTSDKRMKKDWTPFDERYESAYMEMQPVRFMFRNFSEDDHHDRYHCGFLAQDVESTFNKYGIDNQELGLLCIKNLEEPNRGGYMTEYGLRYEEMVALNVHMIQRLYARIAELERRYTDGNL